MTTERTVVQSQQENSVAFSKAVACKCTERDKRFWMAVRRALFITIQAIEERYDMPQTKTGR